MIAESACSHVGGSKDDGGDDNHDKKQPPKQQPAKPKRRSKGKQKIQIKRIESERARLSTFSKRRSGIYKNANELAILCGAQVGVLGVTPAGRVFGYGSPSVDVILQRCLNPQHRLPQREGLDGIVDSIVESHRRYLMIGMCCTVSWSVQSGRNQSRAYQVRTRVEDLNARHDELLEKIEIESERFNSLLRITSPFENSPNPNWLDIPDESDIPDDQLEAAAEELQDVITQIAEFRQMLQRPHIMMPPPAPATAALVNEGAPAQPLQAAAAAAAPEIMNAANPSADIVAAATNNRADEVVDEEELMFRFFEGFPSSPPGPF